MRIQRIRIISCKCPVVAVKRLTCLVSFKDAINQKQRQREKRLAEEKEAAAATSPSVNNNMEDDSTDSKS